MRGVMIVRQSRANAAHFVGGNRSAGARTAQQNAALGVAGNHRVADFAREIGIIDWRLRIGADIENFVAEFSGRNRVALL